MDTFEDEATEIDCRPYCKLLSMTKQKSGKIIHIVFQPVHGKMATVYH